MVFKPGQSGNPLGSQKRSHILRRLRPEDMKTSNDIRGLDIVSSIAGFAHATLQMRLQAGSILAQYQEPLKVSQDLGLAAPSDNETALTNVATICGASASGRIDVNVATKLIDQHMSYIEARTARDIEMEMVALKAELQQLRDQVAKSAALKVALFGGLPAPPGTQILMPRLDEP
jgi:hypothetical protein